MDECLIGLRKSVERFVSLNEEDWNAFSKDWKPIKFQKGDLVTQEGQVERYFYYVESGLLKGFFTKDGTEFNVGFSYKGDYSGIYDSFVSQRPSDWRLEALEDTIGLRIEYNAFQELFDTPKFERWGRLFYQNALIGLGIFIRSLLADTAEEKYNKLMERSPHVFNMIPQKELASYLGMTPETFSRMRKKTMK